MALQLVLRVRARLVQQQLQLQVQQQQLSCCCCCSATALQRLRCGACFRAPALPRPRLVLHLALRRSLRNSTRRLLAEQEAVRSGGSLALKRGARALAPCPRSALRSPARRLHASTSTSTVHATVHGA